MNLGLKLLLSVFCVILISVSATESSVSQFPVTRAPPPAQPPSPPTNNAWNFRGWLSKAFNRGTVGCKWTDAASGNSFDFSSLHKRTGDLTGEDLTYRYNLNFCGVSNAGGMCSSKEGSMCQFSKLTNNFISSLGSFTKDPKPVYAPLNGDINRGVLISMHNGDQCWMNHRQVPRTVRIELECAEVDDKAFTVRELFGQCTHNVHFRTRAACVGAASSGMSFTGFLFLLTVVAAVYVGLGCLYNVKQHGMEWGKLETVPQWAFWVQVPGYTKEGAIWAYTKASEKITEWRTGEKVQYQRLASEEEDVEQGDTQDYDDL